MIDIWPNSKKVDDFWQKLPKSKEPKSKSYVNLYDALMDLFTPAKLIFLATLLLFFFFLGFTPCKAEEPLRGMELQEKKAQKRLQATENPFRKSLQLKDVC